MVCFGGAITAAGAVVVVAAGEPGAAGATTFAADGDDGAGCTRPFTTAAAVPFAAFLSSAVPAATAAAIEYRCCGMAGDAGVGVSATGGGAAMLEAEPGRDVDAGVAAAPARALTGVTGAGATTAVVLAAVV